MQKKLLRQFPEHAVGKLPPEPSVKFDLATASFRSFSSLRSIPGASRLRP